MHTFTVILALAFSLLVAAQDIPDCLITCAAAPPANRKFLSSHCFAAQY